MVSILPSPSTLTRFANEYFPLELKCVSTDLNAVFFMCSWCKIDNFWCNPAFLCLFSGGTKVTVIGQNLDVIQDPHMVVYVNNKKYISVSLLVTFCGDLYLHCNNSYVSSFNDSNFFKIYIFCKCSNDHTCIQFISLSTRAMVLYIVKHQYCWIMSRTWWLWCYLLGYQLHRLSF